MGEKKRKRGVKCVRLICCHQDIWCHRITPKSSSIFRGGCDSWKKELRGEGGVKMIHYLANPFSSSRCLFKPFVTKMCRLCLLYLQSWSKLQNFQAKTDFSRFQQNIFVSCWIKFFLFFVGFHLFVKGLIDWLSPNFWSPSFRMNLIIKSTHQS